MRQMGNHEFKRLLARLWPVALLAVLIGCGIGFFIH